MAVVKDSVNQLSNENNDVAAADTSSKAESSLKVHEAILSTLSDGNTPVNDSIKDVALTVGIQATALSIDRAAIDSKTSSSTLSLDVVLDQQRNAKDAIAMLQETVATSTATSANLVSVTGLSVTISTTSATTSFSETADQKIKEKLQSATDLFNQANDKLSKKAYGEAFVLFKKSQKAVVEAELILRSDMGSNDDSLDTSIDSGDEDLPSATSSDPTSADTSSPSV